MNSYKPAQVFASLPNTTPKKEVKKRNSDKITPFPYEGTTQHETCYVKSSKEIKVSANGELSISPDRCQIVISVHSKKTAVDEAKNSVTRRLDYVLQTLHNHQIKDTEIKVSKYLHKSDGMFHYTAEVHVTFVESEKCQSVCNLLVEKLDDNVKISQPHFYHSPKRLENLRRQACLLAVSNGKQKALEIAKFLQCILGKAVNVEEESCSEWEGSNQLSYDLENDMTFQQKFNQATTHVNARVTVTFELMSTKNKGSNEKS